MMIEFVFQHDTDQQYLILLEVMATEQQYLILQTLTVQGDPIVLC
jgi:hypothetical protein